MTTNRSEADTVAFTVEDRVAKVHFSANSFDNDGRKEGIRRFLDDKRYRTGLGSYNTSRG